MMRSREAGTFNGRPVACPSEKNGQRKQKKRGSASRPDGLSKRPRPIKTGSPDIKVLSATMMELVVTLAVNYWSKASTYVCANASVGDDVLEVGAFASIFTLRCPIPSNKDRVALCVI